MDNDKIDEILSELVKFASSFQISLGKESERGSAIICVTLMEDSLYRLIKAKLAPSPERKDELFDSGYAPLGSFSSKIDLAYRIGLISLEQKSSFHLIRKIRNEFAHSSEEINFESAIIKDRIRELFRLNRGLLNIIGDAKKSELKNDNALSKDLGQGMDYIVKKAGWRAVYELLGSTLAAGIQIRCNQIQQMEPLRIETN